MIKPIPSLKFKVGKVLCDQCSGLGYIIIIGEDNTICRTCNGSGKVQGMIVEEKREAVKKAKKRT